MLLVRLQQLADQLKHCQTDQERLAILGAPLQDELSCEAAVTLKSLSAIGQHFSQDAVEDLVQVERFYKDIGGIVGYHATMLELIEKSKREHEPKGALFHRPLGYDISAPTQEVLDWVHAGIRAVPYLAELYPVGGAADRLQLVDEQTQLPLPAAKLLFLGHTLLEGLVRDVQAREYLYYKLFGEQVTTPIAMMTSPEKDNHQQVLSICEQNRWFGRPKEAFQFICQPLVPLMDGEGKWCQLASGKIASKPGGHGVIWKLCVESGVFKKWEREGKTKILVRQINNPIAGCDYGLLAFVGIGHSRDKAFGFASCPRQVGAAEGVNVLIEQEGFCLTNVEYCDFKKLGIKEREEEFPSNTNILFADIQKVKEAVKQCPIPGMIVNFKNQVARLESTMQNIADCFQDAQLENLQTFLTYHLRRKTISTTKKACDGQALLETPEGCFYDLLHNAHELLTHYCGFEVPVVPSPQEYIEQGPSFLFLYNPALGPLYSIIGQKMRQGTLMPHSELQLSIAEWCCEELFLQGSLKVSADQVMGDASEEGLIRYNTQTGKCTLKRVQIINQGINRDTGHCYWKNEIQRKELCEIILHGNGEFIAEDVRLEGAIRIEVESGWRVRAQEEEGRLVLIREKILEPTWCWTYCLRDDQISLIKRSLPC